MGVNDEPAYTSDQPEHHTPGDTSDIDIINDILVEHDSYRTHQLKTKARRAGYSTDDLQWYSLEALRELTEAVLGAFTPMPPADHVRGGDPAEGGDIQAALADVTRGLYKLLAPEHRAVLLLHHGGYIAASEDSLGDAYTALQACLGGRKPRGL